MPRSKDEVDKVSLGAHRLLHRSCRGKAHGSGIAKQNNCRVAASLSSRKSPVRAAARQQDSCVPGNAVPADRKHSRNSTSSWECSDSDSMHSSEIGQNGCSPVAAENPRSPSVSAGLADRARTDAKERIRRSHGSNYCSPLPRGGKNLRKESWADTLRAGCMDDRIKRMEQGWDDSNVIRTPKERKWQRITAEIEQRIPHPDNGLRMFNGFKNGWMPNGSPKKMSRRSRVCHHRRSKPIQDIVEWEELVELALARKIKRKIRGKGKTGGSGLMEGAGGGGKSVKGDGGCMKRLEVLLENRVSPQIDEVRFARSSAGNLPSRFPFK